MGIAHGDLFALFVIARGNHVAIGLRQKVMCVAFVLGHFIHSRACFLSLLSGRRGMVHSYFSGKKERI